MVMSTKQSKVHNETIWKSTDLRNFPSLDLANLSIYMETGESCCLKWSFSLTLCEIPWRLSSILPNVKISLTHCKIPWQFTDLEKFYFPLTFPCRLWTLIYNSQRIAIRILQKLWKRTTSSIFRNLHIYIKMFCLNRKRGGYGSLTPTMAL